ncbi:MAG: nucleotidyl transferase AbiEii/AbiGii toxin family protein [Gemmatimonadota bacterium]|nr:nucleotidyl transferase AbiEii/AbiGii toxin family protein [Gemmatimonadota bacterium]
MASRPPPDFSAFIAHIARELTGRQLPFMLIGGQAVLLHGQPRLTEDIDITLGVGPSQLNVLQAVCIALGLEPLPQDVSAFVRDTFVLPARHPETAIRVDFIFSTTPYERQAIERAVMVILEGVSVPFAAAEDLIIHKLFAGRPRDIEDAVGVARRQGSALDWAYVERWAREFASVPGRDEMPAHVARLKKGNQPQDRAP